MRRFSVCLLLGLAGCMSEDERLMEVYGRPDSVLKHVPDGILPTAVGMESGCYMYDDFDGQPVFVTDENDQRICVN